MSCRAHSLTATIFRRVIAVPSAETSNSSEPPITPPVYVAGWLCDAAAGVAIRSADPRAAAQEARARMSHASVSHAGRSSPLPRSISGVGSTTRRDGPV